jgi:hypothetical protein
MSQAPSTFGTISTSSLLPTCVTISVTSSRNHGLSRLFTRVHSWQSPKSVAFAILMKPSRAASFLSDAMASSRLPSSTSVCLAMSGTFSAILALLGSKKWIIRDGLKGTSRRGAGAPMASGAKKCLGLRMSRHIDARRRKCQRP